MRAGSFGGKVAVRRHLQECGKLSGETGAGKLARPKEPMAENAFKRGQKASYGILAGQEWDLLCMGL
jgi:hypothetical protein